MKHKTFFKRSAVKLLMVVILLLVAFYFGYLYRQASFTQYLNQFKPARQSVKGFSLINPLVGVDSPNALSIGLFSDTDKKLENLIRESQAEGLITAGIYYRDFNSSIWFGINEKQEFIPASLLKITYAFAAYKESEDENSFLDRQLTYTEDLADETNKRSNADDQTALVVGQSYTVRELIEIMLTKSDNGARDALHSVIKDQYVNEVFTYLGIQAPEAINDYQISAVDYALFFRMLYSSIFINEEHSEELLSILTKTDFSFGITQNLPSKTSVAHKWGVYNFPKSADGTSLQELHDCGIVYEPDTPYLVCIMTKGTNQEVLARFIAKASYIIYEDTTLDKIK